MASANTHISLINCLRVTTVSTVVTYPLPPFYPPNLSQFVHLIGTTNLTSGTLDPVEYSASPALYTESSNEKEKSCHLVSSIILGFLSLMILSNLN